MEPLKHIYSKAFIDDFTAVLKRVYPPLDANRFTKLVFSKTWPEKELKQRMRHIAEVLRQVLPEKFTDATAVIIRCIDELKKTHDTEMSLAFMVFPDFVEVYGIDDFENSILAFEKITVFASAEFAVRPFLLKYPEQMQKQLLKWSKHPQPMVRRLSSEGFRPRLPWAMAIPYLKKDPASLLPILENLKRDPSESVRRSVANNLNDIAKDHPDLVLQLAAKWQGLSPETDWIIRHGSRTLLKKGHPKALQYFGLTETKGVSITSLQTDKKTIRVGDDLNFSFTMTVKKEAKLRIEYGVDYMKANGKQNRKIFKLSESVFEKGDHILKRKQSFRELSTRKHYTGPHTIAIIVNGQEKEAIAFVLGK